VLIYYSNLLLVLLIYTVDINSQIKWLSRTQLPYELTECGSVTLNGKIYIIGGLEPGAVSSTKVYVFDPVINSWDSLAPLPRPMHHMPCAVVNNKIYVLGGYTSNPFEPLSNTYEYDPVSDTWTEKAPVPTIRGAASAVSLGGKIYVIGGAGFNLTQSLNVNEEYNPLTNTWESKGPMPTPRDHHSCAALDSLIYVAGGRDFTSGLNTYNVVEAYSPFTDIWYEADDLIFLRSGFALLEANGKLFAIGGERFTPNGNLVAQIEYYDKTTNKWNYYGNMNSTRHGLGFGINGDTVYTISGGVNPGFSYSSINEAFVLESSIGIQPISNNAEKFTLYQNYPNPFNPVTKIKFEVPQAGFVSVSIFDITGKEVSKPVHSNLERGQFEVTWNAEKFSSGIYFCKIVSGSYSDIKKMVLIK
jgi:N-acetylneuraminic acid mutarotase